MDDKMMNTVDKDVVTEVVESAAASGNTDSNRKMYIGAGVCFLGSIFCEAALKPLVRFIGAKISEGRVKRKAKKNQTTADGMPDIDSIKKDDYNDIG